MINTLLLVQETQYDAGYSLRFGTNRYLSKAADAGNTKKWTLNFRIKPTLLDGNKSIVSAYSSNATRDTVYLDTQGRLNFLCLGVTYQTAPLLLDFSGWANGQIKWDTAQATAADRLIISINGIDVPFSGTLPAQNADSRLNGAYTHYIGQRGGNAEYFDGYLSHVTLVDGGAVDVMAFGYFKYGQFCWRPYLGGYGSKGWHLDFADGSSASNLSKDVSGNGQHFTPTNISASDQSLDSPTNNFAVVNGSIARGDGLISPANGGLYVRTGTITQGRIQWSTIQIPRAGKWIFEVYLLSNEVFFAGILSYAQTLLRRDNVNSGFGAISGREYAVGRGTTGASGIWTAITKSLQDIGGTPFANGDYCTVLYDADAGELKFLRNGVLLSLPSDYDNIPEDDYFFGISTGGAANDQTKIVNFGQFPFQYPQAGYKSLCTANLPKQDSVIETGSFTGNASTDGQFVFLNGAPETLTINGNPVTWGTHAVRQANGFKVITSSSSYNRTGSNTFVATFKTPERNSLFKYQNAGGNL